MAKDEFFTRSWNNWLTAGLGLPIAVYAYVVLTTDVFSDFVAFIGMVVLGVLY